MMQEWDIYRRPAQRLVINSYPKNLTSLWVHNRIDERDRWEPTPQSSRAYRSRSDPHAYDRSR